MHTCVGRSQLEFDNPCGLYRLSKDKSVGIRSVKKKGVTGVNICICFVLKAFANNLLIVGIKLGDTKTKGLNTYAIREAFHATSVNFFRK